MLRRVIAQSGRGLWTRNATRAPLQIATFASKPRAGGDARKTEKAPSAKEDGEPATNELVIPDPNVLARRFHGPDAARRSRYQSVTPANRGLVRRRLLNAYKASGLELPDTAPDEEELKKMRYLEKCFGKGEVDKPHEEGPINVAKMGLLRQIVFTDSVSKVMPQGRTLRFRALIVVGNRRGCAGYAVGKGASVEEAITRGTRTAMKNFTYVDRFDDRTLYQELHGKWNSSTLFLRPASKGRGLQVSDTVACVLDCFGITDVVSKCRGQRNPYTVVPAVFNALSKHQTAEEIALQTGASLVELSTLAQMRNL